MNSLNKKNLINIHSNFKTYKYNLIKNYKKFHKGQASSSFTNIHKISIKDKDKDKTNLENTNLYYKFNQFLFNKKFENNKLNLNINLKKSKSNNKDNSDPSFNIFDNNDLFKNKLIRQSNKNQNIQINVIGHEISINNLLKGKMNKYIYNIVNDRNILIS